MARRDVFFRPGGTLPPGSASYVPRLADTEIVDALLAREFVYILDSRQKGKSSLIVQSLERLHHNDVTTLRIDLQRLGTNLQPEQWYAGILHSIGQELGLIPQLFGYWKDNSAIGPVLRFFGAVESIVLPSKSGPFVIFIDEVDFVLALPFAADEFFAAIRECYNRRSSNPDFKRLTFCLAGVAAPSQLIKNQDVTPFNVGHRIELNDFTIEETLPYVREIIRLGRDGELLLRRIHEWVGGHPYLTQVLASATAEDASVARPSDIDALVQRRLLGAEARQREPNIADLERRVLETVFPGQSKEESRSRILEAHRLLLNGRLISANHEERLISVFLLSGIAVEEEGRLRIRNRLYRELFDNTWRRNNLPDKEAQRQRAASVRAAKKVAWISTTVLAVLCVVVTWLMVLTRDRNQALAESKRLAKANTLIAYQSSIALSAERIQDGDFLDARELIDGQKDSPERGCEWDILNTLIGSSTTIKFAQPNAPVAGRLRGYWVEGADGIEFRDGELRVNGRSAATVPNIHAMASLLDYLRASRDKAPIETRISRALPMISATTVGGPVLTADLRFTARLIPGERSLELTNLATGVRTLVKAPFQPGILRCTCGDLLTVLRDARTGETYDITNRRWIPDVGAFSPDQKLIAVTPTSSPSRIIRASDGSLVCKFSHATPDSTAVWFADGKRLLTLGDDGMMRSWSVPDGKLLRVFVGNRSGLGMATLSADERTVVASFRDGAVMEWPTDNPKSPQIISMGSMQVLSSKISPDGAMCIATQRGVSASLVNLSSSRVVMTYRLGAYYRAPATAFSSDGSICAMAHSGEGVLFVDAHTGAVLRKLQIPGKHPISLDFAHDGRVAIGFKESGIMVLRSWQDNSLTWNSPGFVCSRVKFSMDGQELAVCAQTGEVALIDAESTRLVRLLLANG